MGTAKRRWEASFAVIALKYPGHRGQGSGFRV